MPQALERAVRGYVAMGSGLPAAQVIPGNSKGPAPKGPYATLLLIDRVRLGYPIQRTRPIEEDDETTTTDSLQYWRVFFSLQFFRDGAVDLAFAFQNWAESELALTEAERQEFRVVNAPPLKVLRLDSIFGDSFEKRAVLDLPIDYGEVTTQDTQLVDTIACYLNLDGSIQEGTINGS